MRTPHTPTASLAIAAMVVVIFASLLVFAAMLFSIYRRTEDVLATDMGWEVRTRLLVERGMALAVERLQRRALLESTDAQYCDWTALEYRKPTGEGMFDPGRDEVLGYRRDLPLRRMRFPSWAPSNPGPFFSSPLRVPDETGDGRPESVGYSLRFPSDRESGHDLVSLKVLDCASMIYVNGPVAAPGAWDLAPNVIRMLNTLGATPEIGINGLGLILSEWRVRQQRDFATKNEVIQALRWAGVTEGKILAVRDDLTCHAWVDERTLNPGALAGASAPNAEETPGGKVRWRSGSLPAGRWGRAGRPAWLGGLFPRGLWLGPAADALLGGNAELVPTPLAADPGPPTFGTVPLLQPRAPINVNTASVQVLVAMLEGLEAVALDRTERALHALPSGPGILRRSPASVVDRTTARQLAEHIVSRRTTRPFTCWLDLETFIAGLSEDDLTPLRKRVVLAALNPNSRLAGFNPERNFGLRHGDVDKSALGAWCKGEWDATTNQPFCGWSTEACFSSMGFYQVECLVRLLDAPAAEVYPVIAERSLESVVKVYDVVRLSTQKDFLAHLVSVSTLPDSQPAIQTYPEPAQSETPRPGPESAALTDACLSRPESAQPGRPGCNHALCYDGHVSLAPLDGRPAATPVLEAVFRGGIDARAGERSLPARGSADGGRSLIDPVDPGELVPDGLLCLETRRQGYTPFAGPYGTTAENLDEHVEYPAGLGIPPEGCLELWVKPTWNGDELYDGAADDVTAKAEAADTRTLFSYGSAVGSADSGGRRLVLFARRGILAATFGETQSGAAPTGASLHFADGGPPWGASFSAVGVPIHSWRAGEWHHVRLRWSSRSMILAVDGRRAPCPPLRRTSTPAPTPTSEGLYFLGHNRFAHGLTNGSPLSADATLDSVLISAGRVASTLPVAHRYPAGGSAGTLVLRLTPGVDFPRPRETWTLAGLSWTGRPPLGTGGAILVGAGRREIAAHELRPTPGPNRASGASMLNQIFEADQEAHVTCALLPADPNAFGLVTESPILEEISLTVVGAPRFVSWWMR